MANEIQNAAQKSDNPFRPQSSYWTVVESLRKLGGGKFHPAAKLVEEYRKIVGPEAWRAFKGKEARNEESHKDAEARVAVNATVVCRPDYGRALREAGFEVRKQRTDKGQEFGLFRFNGKIEEPKARKATTKAKPEPKAAAKPEAKPQPKAKSNGKGKGKGTKAKAAKK